MSGYSLALFVHLAALLGAIGTAGIAHLAEARLGAADTIAAARPWAALLNRVAPVFPLALLALLASGTYLVGWVVGRRNRMLRGGR